MRFEVVHPDERDAAGSGRRLGEGEPHQKRADQPRRIGGGDAVEILPRHVRLAQGLAHDRVDETHVGAGGQLGDHALEGKVLGLARNHAGEHPVAEEDRGRGVVAGGLDAEDGTVGQREGRVGHGEESTSLALVGPARNR